MLEYIIFNDENTCTVNRTELAELLEFKLYYMKSSEKHDSNFPIVELEAQIKAIKGIS